MTLRIRKKHLFLWTTTLLVVVVFGMLVWGHKRIAINWWDTPKTQWYTVFSSIPNRITDAIIAVEDQRFYRHRWIDLWASLRALYQTIIKKNTQWWSTIDQQLIKLHDQQFTRTRWRKIYEQRHALALQPAYTKQEILQAYINTVPFSHGIVWRSAACDIYFHKTCEYLSDSELSYLFAVWQLGINPYKTSNQQKIIQRAKIICSVLSQQNITQSSWCSILDTDTPIVIYPLTTHIDPKVRLVLEQQPAALQQRFSQDTYDTIEAILASTQAQREQYDAQYCCVIAIDAQGGIVSMNTCSDWNDEEAGKVNTCMEPRQVGSAIKPFLYLNAFQQFGWTANDTIVDEPVSYDLWDGSMYSPKNFDLTYHGTVSYAYALGNSLNVPAIKILDTLWVDRFLQFLKQQLATYASGYDTNTKNADNVWLSLALGTYEISPYAFAQLWRLFLPWQMIPGYDTKTQEIVDILADPKNKVQSFWQDSFLLVPWRAVKTWTSRKFIDGWVCGVQQARWITLCLWLWNVDNKAMKWPSSEVGSYIWSVIAKEL